ncbi:hypothetical protein EDB81DRAFT_866230 [Dactylonectria macrodidyma]|uniref:DUF7600 domain-containing protein n=1 Tax=Dactylonectria macrodidyma TaxID=307937 RepID=A0A9P9JFY8_9HYPO|nr:hypothetical protein EDB81DRAFT_866230 [Dactylonectria macrodidyma]
MPITDASCFLCGAYICELEHLPKWMGQFRALYTVLQGWGAAHVSGVGRRQQFEDVIPLDESINVDVSESTVEETWVQIGLQKSSFGGKYPPDPPIIPQPLWGFPLHNRCWDLLCALDTKFRKQDTVQALFDLCRSQPIPRGVPNWGHTYKGLVNYDVDIERLFPGEEARLLGPEQTDNAYDCDPMDISYLIFCVSPDANSSGTNWDSTRSRNTRQKLRSEASSNNDPFRLLPPELIIDILVRSQSSDVANLRLASRSMFNVGLPEKFWSSRFWPGHELEHIFELAGTQTPHHGWRSAYDQARSERSNPAMRNRRRVWALACQLRDLVALRLESPLCHGSPCKSFFNPDAANDDRVWHTAQANICPASSGFWPATRVWVSLVVLSDKSYVSGLRLAHNDGETIQLGYCHPRQEFSFIWDGCSGSPHSFVGFQVAMDARGIRGLRLLSTEGARSCWVGDHEGIPKKAIACMNPTNEQPESIRAVKGGFDALKMVSISVHSFDHNGKTERGEENRAKSGESAVWYPDIPDPALRLLGIRDERLVRCLDHVPYSMCLFGGDNGQLLPCLTHMVVWIIDRSALGIYADHTYIWAIEFHYNSSADGVQPMILGRIPEEDPDNSEQRSSYRVSIDSHGGERICGVDALYEDHRSPFALTFHTNHGRSIQVPPEIPSIVSDYFTEMLRPTEGTIVGFFSVLKHNIVFQNLGLAYILP